MKIITNTFDFHIDEPTVVAIGKFDGGHVGHRAIFDEMKKIKANEGLAMVAFTFAFFDTTQILNLVEKRRILSEEGFDYLIEFPFSEDIKNIEADDFLKNVLIDKLNMKHIVGGNDCTFGHNKSGNMQLLKAYSAEFGFNVTEINKVKSGNEDISSTLIRDFINKGEVKRINELLGYPYSITGEVIVGNKLGGKGLGFPTINILPGKDKVFPKMGVYATKVTLPDAKQYLGMTNVGNNPTIKNDRFNHAVRCETHILGYNGDLYGKYIKLEFIEYIRDQKTFSTIEDLKAQLQLDKLTIINHGYKI